MHIRVCHPFTHYYTDLTLYQNAMFFAKIHNPSTVPELIVIPEDSQMRVGAVQSLGFAPLVPEKTDSHHPWVPEASFSSTASHAPSSPLPSPCANACGCRRLLVSP